MICLLEELCRFRLYRDLMRSQIHAIHSTRDRELKGNALSDQTVDCHAHLRQSRF